ncbi:MAG: hypothetical protein J07HN4v3_01627 [Halonotius sp. J07HN4]|nr:MAG: hypothetical protein J07HN4v3_01627 [Halonotius sp. J07HN4]
MVTGEVVDNPRVRGAHHELAVLGAIADILWSGSLKFDRIGVVENPLGFCRREVGVTFEAGFCADFLNLAGFLDLLDAVGGASILPDECVVYWFAGFGIPDNCCLALVGDADRFELVGIEALFIERLVDYELRVLPDLHRVVFDPAGLRIDLFVFFIGLRYDVSVMVEDHETSTGRPLVD